MRAKLRVLGEGGLVGLWDLGVEAVSYSVYPLKVHLLLGMQAASDRRVRLFSHPVVWTCRGKHRIVHLVHG